MVVGVINIPISLRSTFPKKYPKRCLCLIPALDKKMILGMAWLVASRQGSSSCVSFASAYLGRSFSYRKDTAQCVPHWIKITCNHWKPFLDQNYLYQKSMHWDPLDLVKAKVIKPKVLRVLRVLDTSSATRPSTAPLKNLGAK